MVRARMVLRRFVPALLVLAACRDAQPPEPPAPVPPQPPVRPATARPAVPPPEVAIGAAAYERYCATCHGLDRLGYKADNAPSLVSTTFLASASEPFLRIAIELGRPGTAMAGYARSIGGPLAPPEVDALVAFLRWDAPPAVALPEGAISGNAGNGAFLFQALCEKCHGTPMQRADALHLANPALLATASDAFLRHAIQKGRPGTKMEGWEGKLERSQVDDLVAHLRSLARPVPPAVPPPPPAQPSPAPPQAPTRLPIDGPVVVNPTGKRPEFKLREGLYASVAEVGKAFAEKKRIVVVDARAPSDYLRLHIEGAISVPHYDMADLDRIPNDGTWVVAYCACPHHVSGIVVEELRKRGYKRTAVLDEGVFFWQQQGHPVVAAEGQLPIPAPPPPPPPMPATPPAGTTDPWDSQPRH